MNRDRLTFNEKIIICVEDPIYATLESR